MPKVATEMGAILFAYNASVWLQQHPEDNEFQQVAIHLIDEGWNDFRKSSKMYEAQDKIALAHDKSIILRIADGSSHNDSFFNLHATALEHAESSVKTPDLVKTQMARRLQFSTQ